MDVEMSGLEPTEEMEAPMAEDPPVPHPGSPPASQPGSSNLAPAVMAGSGTVDSVTVYLHPLVIMNIS